MPVLIKLNFQNKILVRVIIVFILLAVGVGGILYSTLRQDLYANRLRELEFSTYTYAGKIDLTFAHTKKVAESLASQEEVVEYTKNPTPEDRDEIDKEILEFNIGSEYSAIYILNRDGLAIATTDPDYLGVDFSFRDYFTKSIQGTPHIQVAVGILDSEFTYFFSHPIKDGDQSIGVVVYKLIPGYLEESTFETALEGRFVLDQKLYITDYNSIILYDYQEGNEFKTFSSLNENQKTRIKATKQYPDTEFESMGYIGVSEELQTVSTFKSSIIKDANGNNTQFIFHRIGNTDFFIVSLPDQSNLEASIVKTVLGVIALIFVIMVAALVILSVFLSALLKNLSKIISNVELFRKDGTVIKSTIKTRDELELLSNSFYELSKELVKEKSAIEAKIAERTAQLEKINKTLIGRELKMIELKEKIKKYEDANGNNQPNK
ncbi:hypothetical protein JW978_04330 [Candidatus Dojkabacteria bacterium]|nr:hypothetical protein [Candidatus Dojkabacteria bacterium]